MAVQLVYPATDAQAQTIINKIDAIDAKIVTPTYQDKTVTPSDTQQTVQADNGYTALHSVTVEPIAAAMPEGLEEFIMNTAQEPYSLSLSGNVPDYACYRKTYLKRVYGNLTSIGVNAFAGCSSLQNVDMPNAITIGSFAFADCSSLQNIYAPNLTAVAHSSFRTCIALKSADIRKLQSLSDINYFFGDTNLKYIDARSVKQIGPGTFRNCISLLLIDFTEVNASPPSLDSTAFQNTNNDWIAVVANDTMKAAFQSATNWSTYASHIRTIDEVEQETGMSYDDYYYQCFGHSRF